LRLVAAERVAQILPKGKSTRTRCTTSTGRQSSLRSQTSCSSHDPTPRQKVLKWGAERFGAHDSQRRLIPKLCTAQALLLPNGTAAETKGEQNY